MQGKADAQAQPAPEAAAPGGKGSKGSAVMAGGITTLSQSSVIAKLSPSERQARPINADCPPVQLSVLDAPAFGGASICADALAAVTTGSRSKQKGPVPSRAARKILRPHAKNNHMVPPAHTHIHAHHKHCCCRQIFRAMAADAVHEFPCSM